MTARYRKDNIWKKLKKKRCANCCLQSARYCGRIQARTHWRENIGRDTYMYRLTRMMETFNTFSTANNSHSPKGRHQLFFLCYFRLTFASRDNERHIQAYRSARSKREYSELIVTQSEPTGNALHWIAQNSSRSTWFEYFRRTCSAMKEIRLYFPIRIPVPWDCITYCYVL